MADIHILGKDGEEFKPDAEPDEQPQDEAIKEGRDKVPTVIAQAIKVIHPLFQHPQTGQFLPPPPDHEFRVGVQLSITTKGQVVQEDQGIFFISGDKIDEIAGRIYKLVFDSLEGLEKATSVVQQATPEQMRILEKMKEKE